jgi:hypothetical protein
LAQPTIFAAINKLKPGTMKKLLAVVAIAGTLVACNNSGESTTSNDSTMAPADSNQNMMSTDTMKMSTDTSKMGMDTTKMAGDTTHKK